MSSEVRNEVNSSVTSESDLKGRSVTKIRGRLEQVEGGMMNIEKRSAKLTKRLEGLEGDVNPCKLTFYHVNEVTKPHVERKSR